MKKTIIVSSMLGILLLIGCGTLAFDAESVEKAIESKGAFDITANVDSKNNVEITLKEFTEVSEEFANEEEQYVYFLGVCIGAVGALAAEADGDLGVLDIEIEGDVASFSIDFCAALAEGAVAGELTDEDLGNLIFEVFGFQIMLEESVEAETPFDVSVILFWDDPKFDIHVDLEDITAGSGEWNAFSVEEKLGFFSGTCAGATGVLATMTTLEFDKLIMSFENETWSMPVDFCVDVVEVSESGELSDEEIAEALFANLEKID